MPRPDVDTRTIHLNSLALGLNNHDRATALPFGVATVADNISLYRRNLKTAPGYIRKTNQLPREDALLFDGRQNMLQSNHLTTGSQFALTSAVYTVEILVETSSIATVQTVLYKGKGTTVNGAQAAADLDWSITIEQDTTSGTGILSVIAQLSNGTSLFTTKAHAVTTAGGALIKPNKAYWIVLEQSSSSTNLYVFEPGQSPGTAVLGTAPLTQSDQHLRFFIGGQPIKPSAIVSDNQVSQYHFQGVIQELRIWTLLRSVTDLTNNSQAQIAGTANKIGYYLTGGDSQGVTFTDATGFSVPLTMEPTRARWVQTGLVATSGKSLQFDGLNDLIVIPSAYRYRQVVPDLDGEYPAPTSFWISLSVSVEQLVANATILHYTHLQKSTYLTNFITATVMSGLVGTAGEQFQWVLEVAQDTVHTSEFEFRWIVQAESGGTSRVECVSTNLSTGAGGGVQINTTYQIMLTFTESANNTPTIKIWLNGSNSNAAPDSEVITAGGSPSDPWIPLKTDDDPPGSAVKYLLVLGGAIRKSRKGDNNNANPDDVDWQPHGERYFKGKVDQLVIGAGQPPATNTVNFRANLLEDTYLTRFLIASLNTQVLSCWLLNEGDGDVLEDIGQQGNNLSFKEDPGHLRANSRIETLVRGKVTGLIDQRYRTPTGERKRVLAITSGGIAEVDQTNKVLIHRFDGIRNDLDLEVGLDRWQDSVIVLTGRQPNMMIWRDELYRLSIEPPDQFIPFGATDQIKDAAKLRPGRYLYGFTFFSQFQNKRSPLGVQIAVELRWDANILFGLDAEMLQTYASTPQSLKAPYDFSSGVDAWLRIQAWLATDEGGPGSGDPGNSKVKFTDSSGNKKPWISDKDSATLEELKNAIELRAPRVFVETFSEDSLKIKSRFLGSKARLQVQNAVGAVHNTVNTIFGVSEAVLATQIVDGTGQTGHGISLPVSTDPQVTHLEVWRSLADGTDLRLIARLPNGTTSFKDTISDELNTGEVLDRSLGSVPACRYVVPFGARRLYFGDPLQPQRMYISLPNQPWAVRTGEVVDFSDGRTLELTMAVGSEDNVILTKNNATLVLVPTTNPVVPFQIFTRFRHSGGLAPFGAVEVFGVAMWPDEQGIVAYDASRPVDIMTVIDDTFAALDNEAKSRIHGAHFEDEDVAGWSVATGQTLFLGQKIPDQVLWYAYNTGQGPDGRIYGWTKQTAINAALFALIEDDDDKDELWFADTFGYLYRYGVGHYAGNFDGTAVLTPAILVATGGTSTTVVVPQANLTNLPDGYKGLWITLLHIPSNLQETRLVVADDKAVSSTLTLDHALTILPAQAGDIVLVGLIPSHFETGDMSLGGPDRESKLLRVHINMRAQETVGTFELGWKAHRGIANDPSSFSTIQVDARDDHVQKGVVDNARGMRHRVRIRSTTPGVPFEIDTLSLEAMILGTGTYEGTP
jgi:hypothetical protein